MLEFEITRLPKAVKYEDFCYVYKQKYSNLKAWQFFFRPLRLHLMLTWSKIDNESTLSRLVRDNSMAFYWTNRTNEIWEK